MIHLLRRIPVNSLYLFPLIVCLVLAASCKKPTDDDMALKFSCEYGIVTFDTVFTSIGSVTKKFTVHNTSNSDLTTDIFLVGGKSSFYSINVNGLPGTDFKKVEIPKKDSIFIFVKVNINPKNQNNPFIVTDAIQFFTGTHKQEVKLLAYGQDARYIVADEELGYKVVAGANETVIWTKDRPYVVYGWAVIDSLGTLEIEAGTKVYFHRNAGLWAYRYSNLKVTGTLEEPVLFRGDRLEKDYDEDYEQWNRVWVNEGANVHINYAIITNAFVGIQVDPLPESNVINVVPTTVKVENTIIKNTKHSSVIARFLSLEMTNCLISNTEGCCLQLEGGQYIMKHLTIANYFKTERKNPACYISNYVAAYDKLPSDLKADFYNCIIYGKNDKFETETAVSKVQNAELEVTFQNCLVKAKDNSSYFTNCWRNEDPKFTDIDKLDFTLQPSSPAIGKGKTDIGVLNDLLGKPRGDKPDLGAYQY
ncbi:MAG: hypothetical protein FWC10_07715 [Lentimicrobiaceae bacterium]|nr:hypothetical protein [Lentimicrobiaceae bacterium]